MKRIIICNIPMKKDVLPTRYESSDESLPVSAQAFSYPIISFLSQLLELGDELKVILLVKKDNYSFYMDNVDIFKNEFTSICQPINIEPIYSIIETEFNEAKATHSQLLNDIIDNIDEDSHILADITFGPKDLPIVVFSALFFAENYLRCEIDNIVYGQACFENNKVVKSTICDMNPLYYLSSLSSTIKCDDPQKARKMIKELLSF